MPLPMPEWPSEIPFQTFQKRCKGAGLAQRIETSGGSTCAYLHEGNLLLEVHHKGTGVFKGLPSPFTATRYHSLIVEEPLPDVRVGRDIGAPPPFIGELVDHVSPTCSYTSRHRPWMQSVLPAPLTPESSVNLLGITPYLRANSG